MTLTFQIVYAIQHTDVHAIYANRKAYDDLVAEGMQDDKIYGLDVYVCGSSRHPYCVLYTAQRVQHILES